MWPPGASLALRAGPIWRHHRVGLTRAAGVAAVGGLLAFLTAVVGQASAVAAAGGVAHESTDAAKMFLIGCLKLIALARLYEACCRLARLACGPAGGQGGGGGGGAGHGPARCWLGPAAVMSMACTPLACLALPAGLWGVGGGCGGGSAAAALCRPTELAAYFALLMDLNCLFRVAAAAVAAASAAGAGSGCSASRRLDEVLSGPAMSLASGYAIKAASFCIGGRVAADLSPELCRVCYTMALMLATCSVLHAALLPAFLVRLATESGSNRGRIDDNNSNKQTNNNNNSSADESSENYQVYHYYGSRKQEIKAMMVAGVLLLQSLESGSSGGVGTGTGVASRLSRLLSMLACSPAWDLCLALPYCAYLCLQFATSTTTNTNTAAAAAAVATSNCSPARSGASHATCGSSSGSVGTQTPLEEENRRRQPWRQRVGSDCTPVVSSAAAAAAASARSGLGAATVKRQKSLQQQQPLLRSPEELARLLSNDAGGISNAEYLHLLRRGRIKSRQLESLTGCPNRAVLLRRLHVQSGMPGGHAVMAHIPYEDYDWKLVTGRCCEEVIGLATLPLGLAGPLLVNGCQHQLPLATTEGCLVASINRGCSVVRQAGGCQATVYRDGMTRAPVLAFASAQAAAACLQFVESEPGFRLVASAFEATSAYCRLRSVACLPAGRRLHLRFSAETGDAMGMNMLSKASEAAVAALLSRWPDARLLSLSGNTCADKKPSAINWILGRGKSVVAEARIPESLLRSALRVSVDQLVALNSAKNLEGSALAGAVGGFNAHAANLAAALFIACGQDPAQVVEASQALTCLERDDSDAGEPHLYASVTMPCVEVGVVGGGTHLPSQKACLRLVGLPEEQPAACLAQVLCSGVLCAEISLLAALANQELVASHMKLNRSKRMHHAPS